MEANLLVHNALWSAMFSGHLLTPQPVQWAVWTLGAGRERRQDGVGEVLLPFLRGGDAGAGAGPS